MYLPITTPGRTIAPPPSQRFLDQTGSELPTWPASVAGSTAWVRGQKLTLAADHVVADVDPSDVQRDNPKLTKARAPTWRCAAVVDSRAEGGPPQPRPPAQQLGEDQRRSSPSSTELRLKRSMSRGARRASACNSGSSAI